MTLATATASQLLAQPLLDNVSTVIVGKKGAVELALVSLISRGHILIEDVPGVGKTMLARSIAVTTGCEFRRLQFTPDLLPSDVTGVSVFNQKTENFEFRPGPVMSQIVLADEINRATPKTQSALLEAMGEHQVTVEGVTHKLPSPSWSWRRRTPSNMKAHSRCLKLSWTASSCAYRLATPAATRKLPSSTAVSSPTPLTS